MYCYQCGTEIGEHDKFCSGCGRSLQVPQPQKSVKDMATHVTILGWLFIGNSVLCAFLGITLFMVRPFLSGLSIRVPPDVPFDPIQLALALSGIIGMAMLVIAGLTAAAGVGLLQYQTWARTLALIMAAVIMLKVPLGTALGIYAFWVLLSERGREHYQVQSALMESRTV